MPKVGVVLAGCGFLDGAEIHESVLTLFHLDRHECTVTCFAPDRDQMHVVDHASGEETGEKRNVRTESARIARGPVADLADARAADLDALVMPGGFGVAKNLSDFASRGADCEVDPDLVRVIGEMLDAGKPIVAICISPGVLAAALKQLGRADATLTIGSDESTAEAVEALGQTHKACITTEICVDESRKIISTPAYMLGPGPAAVGEGIGASIDRLMTWLG